ncbi:hypothetical protein, partial [Enterococcus casseliflavus]|uniref:hypothetical protein n=1 Tax=Enterococcus casseliflavus TaxID=37734 RepID=UPI001B807449
FSVLTSQYTIPAINKKEINRCWKTKSNTCIKMVMTITNNTIQPMQPHPFSFSSGTSIIS